MNAYRLMAVAVTTCAVGLSVAACSAGISTKSPVTPRSPDTSSTASSPAASPSTPAAAIPADTVSVSAPIGSFPIPRGAQVVANVGCSQQVLLELSSVTPVQAQTFYASELPRAGYTITGNTMASDPNTGAAQGLGEIMFTGHSYTGLIIAMANLGAQASADPSVGSLPSNIKKNVVEIELSPPGKTSAPMCGG